jgi:hypothetical protein
MNRFDPWAIMRHVFCKLFCPCKGKHDPPSPVVTIGVPGSIVVTFQPKGKFMFTLPDDKTASAAISYVDAKGNAAKVDGAPEWTSSDPTVLAVNAAPDGLTAEILPVGPLGTAQITVKADADLGAGVVELVTLADVEVVAGSAVAGNVSLTLN